MTPQQFIRALEQLFGPHYRLPAAEWFGINEKTVRRWAKNGPPKHVGMLFQVTIEKAEQARRRDQ
jgi:hypothetical protein